MCGIAAILTPHQEKKECFTQKALKLLHHRGPDDQGVWMDESIGLAHTRLSILDLSEAGSQPMHSENKRYVIVYNGEIYNHLELRKKYFPRKNWRGHSDTETILALFEKQGIEMFSEMVGMWALAIWDKKIKQLLISRDRYGQKPLYWRYFRDDESLRFSSEIKPLLNESTTNPMNSLMVAEYLALGNYHHLGEQTFFGEIFQLLPAHYSIIRTGDKKVVSQAYWNVPKIRRENKIPFGSKEQEKLKVLMLQAVQSQLLSDVPVGATLSGGVDSSCICGIIAATSTNGAFSVFTAQTQGSPLDETKYVEEVIEKWGQDKLELFSKELMSVRLEDTLPQLTRIQEEPFGDPSIFAHGLLMDLAKENGVKVILGGQGADELFFGYPSMINSLLAHELASGHFKYVRDQIKLLGWKPDPKRLLLGAVLPKTERKLRLWSREKKRFVLSDSLREAVSGQNPNLSLFNDFYGAWEESIFGNHIPHLLHYDDRNAMARSIEGRTPFLDHRIIEFLAQLQPSSFLNNGQTKNALRVACREFLPVEIAKRKDKIGFFTPLDEYVRSENKWIKEVIFDYAGPWINRDLIEKDLKFYETLGDNFIFSQRIWRCLSFAGWINSFQVSN